jgi:hypothetical protein
MTNCCNSYGQCDRNKDCPARESSQAKGRAIEAENWGFPAEELLPPYTELRDAAFKIATWIIAAIILTIVFISGV